MDPMNIPAKLEVHSFTRSWDNRGYVKTWGSPWICRWRSSKVTNFGANRKRVNDFYYSNLGPVSHALFWRYWRLLVLLSYPTLIPPKILGMFPLHQIAHVGVHPSRGLKLFGHVIIFEEFQPTCMWSWYLNVAHRQTDRGLRLVDNSGQYETKPCSMYHRK